ncbi:MAG: hypothetical protein ACR2NO_07535 [Chloroflexota bacterium]
MSKLKSGAFRRRDFNRYTAAAGALAGLAPLAQLAPRFAGAAHAQAAIMERLTGLRSDQMGLNESFKAINFGNKSGAGWTRWTVGWNNAEKQIGKVDPFYFQGLDEQLKTMSVAAMVVGTPDHSGSGGPTAIPTGLYEPTMLGGAPNPANRFAEFMFNLARDYAGRLNVFEIWNEVEIPSTGANARYNTWAGGPTEYKQLVKVAGQAAKSANPRARIITSPYSYFRDAEEGMVDGISRSLPFWDAFEAAVREDAEMASLIDGVALNLYRNPHDLWDRAWGAVPEYLQVPDRKGFFPRLASMGLAGKQAWLTEINAMPFDDPVPGWNPGSKSRDAEPLGLRLTMDEQAAYIWQALGTAAAAGWNKIFFQALQDDNPVVDELWGLVRHNGNAQNADESRARPAYWAYTLAARLLGDGDMSQLYVRVRPDAVLSKHRQNASRYKWGAQAVVVQKGDLRTTVIWNSSPDTVTVNVAAKGSEALLIDKTGNPQPLNTSGGAHNITIGPATVRFSWPNSPFGPLEDPVNYYYVGGDPMILIETGVSDHAVNIANFIRKDAAPENGSGPDATSAGDIVDNGPGMNPRVVGHDPNRVGRLR